MVKRYCYQNWAADDPRSVMQENNGGLWVNFKDYQELERQAEHQATRISGKLQD